MHKETGAQPDIGEIAVALCMLNLHFTEQFTSRPLSHFFFCSLLVFFRINAQCVLQNPSSFHSVNNDMKKTISGTVTAYNSLEIYFFIYYSTYFTYSVYYLYRSIILPLCSFFFFILFLLLLICYIVMYLLKIAILFYFFIR